jgi:putative ABC transport system permease protein
MVLTAGLGMLLFSLAALESSAVSADDRIAVAAGAEAVATLDGSWELDPAAATVPPPVPDGEPDPEGPVPGVRTPPLPPGNTLVWRTDFITPLDGVQRDMLIVDPATFAQVALWGRGAGLAAARDGVSALAARPASPGPSDRDAPIPAIAVADPAADGLNSLFVTVGYDTRELSVVARAPAFPSLEGRPMWVVPADHVFGPAGTADPRLRPRSRLDTSPLFVRTFQWNSTGASGVAAVTAATGTQPERVGTAAEVRQGDAYVATRSARGYQLAVAAYLALLAVLTLGVYAQRTAAARRPADLMLARVGLGRSRIRWAGALEFALLAAIALGAAVAGVAGLALVGGRLLDDQPGLPPAFEFRQPPAALVVTAGVALAATLIAVALTTVLSRSAEEDAYRDD